MNNNSNNNSNNNPFVTPTHQQIVVVSPVAPVQGPQFAAGELSPIPHNPDDTHVLDDMDITIAAHQANNNINETTNSVNTTAPDESLDLSGHNLNPEDLLGAMNP